MGNFDRTQWYYSVFKMDVTIWLSVLLAVLTLGTPASSSEPRVVCYYTNWSVYRPGTAKFNPQNINPYLCTHLVYAFGGFTKDNSLKPFDKYQDIEKGGYAKFTGLKTYNKNLKTLLAIGGWNEGSSRFSPMVASRERRKEFVRNVIKFLRQNRFDGLDLDWEYPAFRDGGKPKDKDHYAKFVKELREEFETESEKTGKQRLLLTMAVPAGIEYIQKGFDVKTLNKYLDWMNLLTYDYHSAFEPAVNHHAPLYPYEEPNEYSVDSELNIDYTIKFYLEQGADADKLVLGIPTYGRSYTLFNPDAVDLGSPADGPGEQGDATREKGYLAYYEICEALKPKKPKKRSPGSDEDSDEYEEEKEEQPWTVMYPNAAAMGPVAYRGNQWVGYDDEDIVRKKAEYVAEKQLGGIMFWSIDNDDFRGTCHGKPYPLIEAAKEAYYAKLGSTINTVAQTVRTPITRPSNQRKSRPKTTPTSTRLTPSTSSTSNTPSTRGAPRITTTTTTTTTRKPTTVGATSDRVTSTTPVWTFNTPEPPTTPDPGTDFKCEDEGFFPHPRDCKKYFWCLDSGPSNLGIVAHQFTCPSGLYFNKAADSCDFARNVLCKKPPATTKTTTVKPPTTTTPTTTTTTTVFTTRKAFLSTKNSVLFRSRTSTTTTPKPAAEENFEEDSIEEDSEDPRVIKELIDLIRKVGGIEQLEKQLHLGESSSSSGELITTTPSSFNKVLYQKVLERTRGRNKNNIIDTLSQSVKTVQNNRRGPQNAGLEAPSLDNEKSPSPSRRDRPQYITINRQRGTTTTTAIPEDSDEEYVDEDEAKFMQTFKNKAVSQNEVQQNVATTAKTLQYVNIRRGRPNTEGTSDTADDTASRNALFERQEPLVAISETSNAVEALSARRETKPEYVTIRRQRPTTEETTTVQYQESDEVEEEQPTLLEKELSSRPKYNTIVRSTTLAPEEPSTRPPSFKIYTLQTDAPEDPDPTTVLAVQISSLLNSPNPSGVETDELEAPIPVYEEESITTSTTTTTTTQAPLKRTITPRRRGSTIKTTPAPTSATQGSASAQPGREDCGLSTSGTAGSHAVLRRQSSFDETVKLSATIVNMAPRRNFLRRTKATAPPETTEASSNTDTTTQKYTRRGNSKFKLRKDAEKNVETNEIANVRPSLNSGGRQYERPPPAPATRKFVSRRRLGGANTTLPVPVSTTTAAPLSNSTRRVNRIISRRRQLNTNATTRATTKLLEDEESLQDIGDTDAIEDPSLEPRKGKASSKLQRRPLILKDQNSDQNPSATNEDENKRQSKKYSASIKQIQLDDLVKKSQEESSTENNEKNTPVEDISPETAVALAAHQLITAPVPIVTDYEDDDVKPTRNGQTTVEYKYSSREYNEFTDTDSKTPTFDDYQSTPVYKTNTLGNDETTPYNTQIEFGTSKISDFDSTKTDFDDSKTTSEKYSTPEYKTVDYIQTTDIDSSRISTYDVPKLTNFPNTASTASNQDYSLTTSTGYSESDYKSPVVTSTAYTSKSPSTNTVTGRYFSTTGSDSYTTGPNDFDSTLLGYISKSDYSDAVTKNYIRSNTSPETSTEFTSRNSPYVPNYASTAYSNPKTLDDTVLEENLSRNRISTTLSPPPASRQGFERTTLAGISARMPSAFTPRVTEATKLRNEIDRETNAATAGYSFIQRGTSKFRNDRLLPVPVDDSGYSTVGYSRSSQDPSYYTREYLLESPVTKTFDADYKDIDMPPVTTTPTPTLTRRVIRKKIQRKISTTQRPTTTPQPKPTTTVKPRRVPAKPFEKVSKAQNKTYRPIANYDYYDDSDEKVAVKYLEGTKVVMHDNGSIECLDIGNFPHPTSCKKFISCARIENGSLLGWEYICPKGLSFDPVGGICNWSAGLGCNEKDL